MNPAPPFERAFVAVSVLLGARAGASGLAEPSPEAAALSDELARGDRPERARKLAGELARIAAALEARRLA